MGAVYMECSAKERIGVDDIFDAAIILSTSEEGEANDDSPFGAAAKQQHKALKRRRMRKACKIL
jgi:hypothetical protein